jgi:hypothetical protein
MYANNDLKLISNFSSLLTPLHNIVYVNDLYFEKYMKIVVSLCKQTSHHYNIKVVDVYRG